MVSKSQVTYIRSLRQKKYREELQLFVAEGPKVVNDLLQSGFHAKEIFTTDKKAFSSSKNVVEVSEKELESISSLTTPNTVLAVFEIKQQAIDYNVLKQQTLIALDDIRDPGNLGTIIRTADWFGIRTILCSDTCVDAYNPKTTQATMGSIARVQIAYVDLERILPKFEKVYGAVLNGENIYRMKPAQQAVILIGSESHGISTNLLKLVTHRVSIPNFSSGAESLNAATACAILCSEFKRTSL